MFTSGEKIFNIFDIFFIIILLLSINQIILSVILMNQVNSSLKHSIKELVEDTSISTIESISFQYKYAQNESKPRYIPSESNLGFAGELILD